MKDFYQTLGVSKNASDKEIKSSYRVLAKKYHPDLNPGDAKAEEMFKEISKAYAILGNPTKRAAYDSGAMNEHGDVQQQNPFSHFNYNFFNPFEHIYEPRKINLNSNIEATLIINPIESFTEQSKKIEYQRLIFCKDCNGNGGKNGTIVCPNCHGRKFSSQKINQHTIIEGPCERCQQRGFIFNQVCESCHGFGVKKEQTSYDIKIPVGSYFKKLRVTGGGQHTNPNHPIGDLFINILPPKQYKEFQFTPDCTVYKEILIDPIDAVIGVEKEVEDIKGEKFILSVPAGCQEKQILTIEKRGLMIDENKRGVFNVVVKYDYNIKRTDEQTKILKEYAKTKNK